MSSTRLPRKVLADVGGQPALRLMLDRLSRSTEIDDLVVATSTDPTDDAIADLDLPVFRGPLADVLERFRLALEPRDADAVVRLTADCPLIDPEIVDAVVRRWRNGSETYVSNIDPRTFPKGLDTEVVSREAIVTAAREATAAYDREHVTPFIRERPQRFPSASVIMDPNHSSVRITLDTREDLDLIRRVVKAVGPAASYNEILRSLGLQGARIRADQARDLPS
jgi:spore coat polysaccharide biosynthesis protein SpsF (cytidylyltransferase family)